ncbi:hypothetical protein ACRAWC_25155 [Leifsonia sp. L25]|uniref:hypothetical protein n=1 Tax=Leifsonia sp. L25 TaxID=3423957 RepID=UPI003D692F65
MSRQAVGLAVVLAAQLSFSSSSILLKPLLDAGWSPAAAVGVRVALGGLILAVPALISLRGDLRPLLGAGVSSSGTPSSPSRGRRCSTSRRCSGCRSRSRCSSSTPRPC